MPLPKYLCDHTIHRVQTPEKSTHFLNNNLEYRAAYTQCIDKADGRDFSLVKNYQGTVCQVLHKPIDSSSKTDRIPGPVTYGAVCYMPGQVLRYKADEDRLSDNLRVLLN